MGSADPGHTTETPLVAAPRDQPLAPPQAPAGRLVCLIGSQAGQDIPLAGRTLTLGRSHAADLLIDGHDVSRLHAQIEWFDGHHQIHDLGSRNGTSINGVRVRDAVLRIGDRIRLGTTALLVYEHDDELERRAARLQMLESLAHLAGGIVHDFKNTLGVILVNVELVQRLLHARRDEDPMVFACLDDVLAATRSGDELTQRLLQFARRTAPAETTTVNLADLVGELGTMVRLSLDREPPVRLEVDVPPDLVVRGQASELQNALLNLCLNARDAMPQGGRLSIGARAVELGRIEALELHLPAPGRYVEITVADNGAGMDAGILAHVFEPFFTTKPPGRGTGLGLSTVYGVVRNHGGNVLVDSARDQGSRFLILLPLSPR